MCVYVRGGAWRNFLYVMKMVCFLARKKLGIAARKDHILEVIIKA